MASYNFQAAIETLIDKLITSGRFNGIKTLLLIDVEYGVLATPTPSSALWSVKFVKMLTKSPFDWLNISETMPSSEFGVTPKDYLVTSVSQVLRQYQEDPSCLIILLSQRDWKHWRTLNSILLNELDLRYDLLIMREIIPEIEETEVCSYSMQYNQTLFIYLAKSFPQLHNIMVYSTDPLAANEYRRLIRAANLSQRFNTQFEYIASNIKCLPRDLEYDMVKRITQEFDNNPFENDGIPLSSPLGQLNFINLIKLRNLLFFQLSPKDLNRLKQIANNLYPTTRSPNWSTSSFNLPLKAKSLTQVIKHVETHTEFELKPISYGILENKIIAFKFQISPQILPTPDTITIAIMYNPNLTSEFDTKDIAKFENLAQRDQVTISGTLYSINQYDLKIDYK
jgi:hypothetical protein